MSQSCDYPQVEVVHFTPSLLGNSTLKAGDYQPGPRNARLRVCIDESGFGTLIEEVADSQGSAPKTCERPNLASTFVTFLHQPNPTAHEKRNPMHSSHCGDDLRGTTAGRTCGCQGQNWAHLALPADAAGLEPQRRGHQGLLFPRSRSRPVNRSPAGKVPLPRPCIPVREWRTATFLLGDQCGMLLGCQTGR